MSNMAKKISLVFAAGVLGALLNSLAVWIFGELGITTALGVKIAPKISAVWLYPRLAWGGSRGFIYSLGPTLVQLFVVFPMKAQKGVMGGDLGLLTPLFVVFFNAIWGWTAAIWLRWTGK